MLERRFQIYDRSKPKAPFGDIYLTDFPGKGVNATKPRRHTGRMAKIPKSPAGGQNWLGKIKGHVGEAKDCLSADARQRDAAEKGKDSTILTERMQHSGLAGKVLHTMLNGGLVPITANELATFRRNMLLAKQQDGFAVGGITSRQIIDLASAKPLRYVNEKNDIDKAKQEITTAIPVSALKEEVSFITNAGEGSKAGRHHVTIQFTGFKNAVDSIIAAGDDPKALRRAADKMRKAA